MEGESFVAQRMASVAASGIRRIFDLAATIEDPIDLSIGQPDFDVPDPIKRAAVAAIESGRNGYTVTQGLAPLRDAIRARLAREPHFAGWDPPVIVVSGVSGGLVLALLTSVNPGDEVLFADPYFVSYPHLIALCGGVGRPIDTYPDFILTPKRLEAAVTGRTRAIIVNSPANPTGVVYSPDQMRAVAEFARRHGLLMVSDEIYNLLSFDGRPVSPADFAPERTLLLRGFGKSWGMTGWRIAYAAGPEALISAMTRLQQFTYVCAPHMAQYGAIEALKTDMSAKVAEYGRKRDLVVGLLSQRFEITAPSGGFYVFPKCPPGCDSATAFVERAIAHKVMVIPGNVFSARDTHFRVSYAAPDDKLRRGCDVLTRLAAAG